MSTGINYGFWNLRDLFDERVEKVGESIVADAINQSVAEHNRQLDALMSLFVNPVTDFQIKNKTPGIARLQPLDEDGRPLPIKRTGSYGVAFPLQMAGTAWGANFVTRRKMTVSEANEATSTLIDADRRWMRDHILAALFDNTGWTFDDPFHDLIDVKGLANGDATIYQVQQGGDAGATDDHYLAQAAAIDDLNDPFRLIYNEITEHPENGGQAANILAFVPEGQVDAIEALAGFSPRVDPNVTLATDTSRLIADPSIVTPGEFLGYHSARVWLYEWKSLPAGYMVALSTEGSRSLGMRQDVETSLQGFIRGDERNDFPYIETPWIRRAGFGGLNRVGALVYQIGAGAYSIPANYTSPMP